MLSGGEKALGVLTADLPLRGERTVKLLEPAESESPGNMLELNP